MGLSFQANASTDDKILLMKQELDRLGAAIANYKPQSIFGISVNGAGQLASNSLVAKLNADYLDGHHWGDVVGGFAPLSFVTTLSALNGLVKCDGAGSFSAITDNSAAWNTWGSSPAAGISSGNIIAWNSAVTALNASALSPNAYTKWSGTKLVNALASDDGNSLTVAIGASLFSGIQFNNGNSKYTSMVTYGHTFSASTLYGFALDDLSQIGTNSPIAMAFTSGANTPFVWGGSSAAWAQLNQYGLGIGYTPVNGGPQLVVENANPVIASYSNSSAAAATLQATVPGSSTNGPSAFLMSYGSSYSATTRRSVALTSNQELWADQSLFITANDSGAIYVGSASYSWINFNRYGAWIGGTGTAATANIPLYISSAQSANVNAYILNTTSGAAAYAGLLIGQAATGGHYCNLVFTSPGFTTSGDQIADGFQILSGGAGGITLSAYNASSGVINFFVAGEAASNKVGSINQYGLSVGSNAAAPDPQLWVTSSANNRAQIKLTAATGTYASFFQSVNTGGSMVAGMENSAGAALFTGSAAYAAVIGNSGNNPLQFATNNTVRATISATGGVSIGTATDPGAANLLVSGDITTSSDLSVTDTLHHLNSIMAGNSSSGNHLLLGGIGHAGTVDIGDLTAGVHVYSSLYTAGNLLVSGDIYTVALTDYTSSSTIGGWVGSPTGTIKYKQVGKTVHVYFNLTGTGNGGNLQFTVPLTANGTFNNACTYYQTGAGGASGFAQIASNATVAIYDHAGVVASLLAPGASLWGELVYESA